MLGKISLPENIRSSPRTGYCKVICVVGGRSNSRDYVSSVQIYEPEKNEWTVLDNVDKELSGAVSTVLAGKMYMFGGM